MPTSLKTAVRILGGFVVISLMTIYGTAGLFYLLEKSNFDDFFGLAGLFIYFVVAGIIIFELIFLILSRHRPRVFWGGIILVSGLSILLAVPSTINEIRNWINRDRSYSSDSISDCKKAKSATAWQYCIESQVKTEADRAICLSQIEIPILARVVAERGGTASDMCDTAFAKATNQPGFCRYSFHNCIIEIANAIEEKDPRLKFGQIQSCLKLADQQQRVECLESVVMGYNQLVDSWPSRLALCQVIAKYLLTLDVNDCASDTGAPLKY